MHTITTIDIEAIPAFEDNYIWLLSRDHQAVVVDPGDAAPVLQVLRERGLRLAGILVTHHHPDHIGGIGTLVQQNPVPVWGPASEIERIPHITQPLQDGDRLEVLQRTFSVMAVPGHTRGHIAYYTVGTPGLLLCGDTLFSAGCGRLFEGTPQQMHASLSRLAALPGDTAVYCTHEYTTANLMFASAVEPDNADIAAHRAHVATLRAAGRPSLPSSIELERRINPFLRTEAATVQRAAAAQAQVPLQSQVEVFGALRQWKDHFRA